MSVSFDPKFIKFSKSTASSSLLTDLVAYWAFEEAAGTVYDSTANNWDLTSTSTLYQQAGRVTYGAGADAATDVLYGGTGAGLKLTTFSVSAWFKRNTTSTSEVIISEEYWDPGTYGWRMFIDGTSTHSLIFEWMSSTPSDEVITSSMTVDNNAWHHVVITFAGSGSNVRMYIDGTEDTAGSSPQAIGSNPSYEANAKPYILNSSYDDSALLGTVDEIGIWSKVLSI
jgi:hypothetical protein